MPSNSPTPPPTHHQKKEIKKKKKNLFASFTLQVEAIYWLHLFGQVWIKLNVSHYYVHILVWERARLEV